MSVTRSTAAVGAIAIALTVSACAESKRDTTSSSGGTAAASGDTFTFGAAGAPKLFDPFYASDGETFRPARQIFETLISFKPGTADVAPGLAEKWDKSADGKTWTFTLHKNMKFTDGTALDAAAVCKNFERMYDQTGDGQNPSASSYWQDNFGGFKDGKAPSLYKSCEAKDATTVVLALNSVTSKFPALLGHTAFAMQSPTAMDKYKANEVKAQGEGFTYSEYAMKHPTGSGPFKLESYDEANKTITLVRNDDYWGEKAKVAKLVFKIIPDESARRQELQAGSIQGYDLPNPVDWKSLQDAGNQVMIRPAFNILYLGFNAGMNPKLKDLKVRQALAMAINRDQIVKTQLPEGAKVASQFMPDTVTGYNKTLQPIPFDQAKAKALLAEAGASNLSIDLWYPSEVSRPYMPAPQQIFEAIRSDWEKIGVKVNPVTKPWNGGYLDQVDNGKAPAFLLGWTGDYNTPDNFIGTFFGSLDNRFGLKNYDFGPELVKTLHADDAIIDEAARTKAYEEINAKLVQDYLPAVPISHSPPALVLAKGVSGVTPSPLNDERFPNVTVSK